MFLFYTSKTSQESEVFKVQPYKSAYAEAPCSFQQESPPPSPRFLFLLENLQDVELQVIRLRLIGRPENRVIRRLCAVFNLTDPLVRIPRRGINCLEKELRRHKVRA